MAHVEAAKRPVRSAEEMWPSGAGRQEQPSRSESAGSQHYLACAHTYRPLAAGDDNRGGSGLGIDVQIVHGAVEMDRNCPGALDRRTIETGEFRLSRPAFERVRPQLRSE